MGPVPFPRLRVAIRGRFWPLERQQLADGGWYRRPCREKIETNEWRSSRTVHSSGPTVADRTNSFAVLLAPDGVDPQLHPRATNWREICDEMIRSGPESVSQSIYDAESADPEGQCGPRSKPHDDKTLAAVVFK